MVARSSIPTSSKGTRTKDWPETLCCKRASLMWAGGSTDWLTYKLLLHFPDQELISLGQFMVSSQSLCWANKTRLVTKNFKIIVNVLKLQKIISKFLNVKPTASVHQVSGPGSWLHKACKLYKGRGFQPNLTKMVSLRVFQSLCKKANYNLLYPSSVLIQSPSFLPLLYTTKHFQQLYPIFTTSNYKKMLPVY